MQKSKSSSNSIPQLGQYFSITLGSSSLSEISIFLDAMFKIDACDIGFPQNTQKLIPFSTLFPQL